MAWRKDATERRSIWPYDVYENHIKVEMRGRRLRAGEQVGNAFEGKNWKYEKRSLNSAFLIWQAYKETDPWDELELQFTLTMQNPDRFRQEVFSSERLPVCVYAIDGLCKSTRWRSAITAPYGPENVMINLRVQAKDLFGTVSFSPFVLLWEDRTDAPQRQARRKGSRVATGFPIQVQVDEPMDKPGRGLEILWHSFPGEVSDALYELNIEPPRPILKLNNGHPSLKLIIEDLSKVGNRARLRNALFSFIAVDTWMQLAQYAARTHKLDSDDEEDPSFVLSRKILRTLTKMLKCPPEDVLEAFEDHQSSSRLRLRLQHHLQTASRQDALITGLTEEAQELA